MHDTYRFSFAIPSEQFWGPYGTGIEVEAAVREAANDTEVRVYRIDYDDVASEGTFPRFYATAPSRKDAQEFLIEIGRFQPQKVEEER